MRKLVLEGLTIPAEKLQGILEKTGGHCPCVTKSARSEDTLCQCKKFREERECCCGYYA